MQNYSTFTITIEAQEMLVRYKPRCFGDYAHFEFTSPYEPPRRIIISETGYKSHFSPMHEIEEAPSVEAYAHALALAFMGGKAPIANDNEEEEDEGGQLALF